MRMMYKVNNIIFDVCSINYKLRRPQINNAVVIGPTTEPDI